MSHQSLSDHVFEVLGGDYNCLVCGFCLHVDDMKRFGIVEEDLFIGKLDYDLPENLDREEPYEISYDNPQSFTVTELYDYLKDL